MSQCLIKVLAGLVDEIHYALFLNEGAQCQCVDKHTHGVADTQVGTSVADGGDAQLLVVGEAGECIECGSKKVVGWRYIVLATETIDFIEVQRRVDCAYQALFLRIDQVCSYFRSAFYLIQSLLEEMACLGIFLTALCFFLCSHKVGVGKSLRLYLLAVHQIAQLIYE